MQHQDSRILASRGLGRCGKLVVLPVEPFALQGLVMLRVLGSPKKLCNGTTRREALVAGGLSLFGLTLSDALRAEGATKGRAKSCILLYLYGSPSQLEMADMKPDAPVEIRGELKPIRSTLAGCDVCELLPHTAKIMNRVSVVRSLTHQHPIHGVAYATTGIPDIEVSMELNRYDSRHWPFIGSVVSYLERHNAKKPVPDNIALPFPFSSQRTGEVHRAGPYAAFLGSQHQPHFTQFLGQANRKMTKTLLDKTIEFDEPYVGISPDARFTLGEATQLPPEITIDRLDKRKSLLAQFEEARRGIDQLPMQHLDPMRKRAYDMIGNESIRQALDVRREVPGMREHYGHTLFGQSCLAARRLVEAGSKFVTVFWDEYGLAGSGWDTHWDHYSRLKNELMPGFDRGFSGLIADLDARGMLDETLVVVLSEHGRTPKITPERGGGRDHWSQAYSAFFAGGGVARGKVIGKTDKIGGSVVDQPISPKDVLATIYHLLGYNLETTLVDKLNRPQHLAPNASIISGLLA
jgi:Protein of unknown function (DUF1501)